MKLEGDAIVLAGATGRVGGATLRTLIAHGARVLVVSRSEESAKRVVGSLDGERRDAALPFVADLSVESEGERVARGAFDAFGRIDAVVCLAGGGTPFKTIATSTLADLHAGYQNNLVIAYNAVVPALRRALRQEQNPQRRSRARFVAVTAGSSLDPQPTYGIMGAGKAGVNVLMLAIAREHKADGIVANAVVLGGVATDVARAYLEERDFAAAASPQEVADVLAFHASDASSGINGALIHLNARETD